MADVCEGHSVTETWWARSMTTLMSRVSWVIRLLGRLTGWCQRCHAESMKTMKKALQQRAFRVNVHCLLSAAKRGMVSLHWAVDSNVFQRFQRYGVGAHSFSVHT